MAGLTELTIASAFFVGLMGAVHCAGMCGGITAAVSAPWSQVKPQSAWVLRLAYNTGRILSYGIAGALAGGLSSAGLLFRDVVPLQQIFLLLASLMLLGLGLYLAGAAPFVGRIEAIGAMLWRQIQPYSRRLLPVDTAWRALGLGALWGWLPCGLVYTMLLSALAAGDPIGGASVMLAFGVGTLPNLLAMGIFFSRFRALMQSVKTRMFAGMIVAGFGGYGLIQLYESVMAGGWVCHSIG